MKLYDTEGKMCYIVPDTIRICDEGLDLTLCAVRAFGGLLSPVCITGSAEEMRELADMILRMCDKSEGRE